MHSEHHVAEFVTHLITTAMRFKGGLREAPDEQCSAKRGHVGSMSAHTGNARLQKVPIFLNKPYIQTCIN